MLPRQPSGQRAMMHFGMQSMRHSGHRQTCQINQLPKRRSWVRRNLRKQTSCRLLIHLHRVGRPHHRARILHRHRSSRHGRRHPSSGPLISARTTREAGANRVQPGSSWQSWASSSFAVAASCSRSLSYPRSMTDCNRTSHWLRTHSFSCDVGGLTSAPTELGRGVALYAKALATGMTKIRFPSARA